jgi:hypothetical protein
MSEFAKKLFASDFMAPGVSFDKLRNRGLKREPQQGELN